MLFPWIIVLSQLTSSEVTSAGNVRSDILLETMQHTSLTLFRDTAITSSSFQWCSAHTDLCREPTSDFPLCTVSHASLRP